jgi:hypothetical protein
MFGYLPFGYAAFAVASVEAIGVGTSAGAATIAGVGAELGAGVGSAAGAVVVSGVGSETSVSTGNSVGAATITGMSAVNGTSAGIAAAAAVGSFTLLHPSVTTPGARRISGTEYAAGRRAAPPLPSRRAVGNLQPRRAVR